MQSEDFKLLRVCVIPQFLLKETVPCYFGLSGSAAYCFEQVEGCGLRVAMDVACVCLKAKPGRHLLRLLAERRLSPKPRLVLFTFRAEEIEAEDRRKIQG